MWRVWKGLGAMKDSRALRRAESDGWGGFFFVIFAMVNCPTGVRTPYGRV